MRAFLSIAVAILPLVRFDTVTQTSALRTLPAITLDELREAPFGTPFGLTLDPDGGFYVVDSKQAGVSRFDRHGRGLRHYGRSGDGPGEFEAATEPTVIDDSTLAIADLMRRDLTLLDRRTGRFRQRISIGHLIGSIAPTAHHILIGARALSPRHSVASLDLATGTVTLLYGLPAEYVKGGPLAGTRYRVFVRPRGDTLWIGWEGTNYLVRAVGGIVVDTLQFPRRRRKGVPRDPNAQLERLPFAQQFAFMSSLIGLSVLPDGRVLAAHLDAALSHQIPSRIMPGAPLPITSRLYLTLLDLPAHRACVDLEVPISDDIVPAVAFAADTLMVLDQEPKGADIQTVVRRFLVDDPHCVWTSLP